MVLKASKNPVVLTFVQGTIPFIGVFFSSLPLHPSSAFPGIPFCCCHQYKSFDPH